MVELLDELVSVDPVALFDPVVAVELVPAVSAEPDAPVLVAAVEFVVCVEPKPRAIAETI